MVWRIGDGKPVCITKDKSLPDQVYKSVSSPLPSIPPNAKVSSLIDAESGAWKTDDIRHLLLPHDAKVILRIPLSIRLPHDSLIWSKKPSDVFTTRSAYKLLASDASASSPGSANSHPQKSLWRGVWMLQTPNKVRHFIWRAYNNSLPTMDNLLHRHIIQSDCCNICRTHPKDILHVVWGCTELASMWSTLSWAHQSASPLPGDFTNLFSRFLQVHEDYRMEIFAFTAWLLWNHGNAI